MSTPVSTARTKPTQVTTFYTPDTKELLTFEWTNTMPEKGYLGNVTFRQYKKKPIQVFRPEEISSYGVPLGTSWQYQAQDGSFLCRMFVSAHLDSFITFSERKKGDWPLITLLAPHHSSLGSSSESTQVT